MPSGNADKRKSGGGGTKRPAAKRRRGGSDTIWRKVADKIEADIKAGRFSESGRLPPETAVAREHGVNRHTLRRAIAALVKKGLLRSVPHIGSFVGPLRLALHLRADTRFSEALERVGMVPGGRLLSQRVCVPPEPIARQLRIARRSEVFELVHIRTANDLPLSFVTSWVPADRFPRIAEIFKMTGSLRRALAQLGVPSYERTSIRISSRLATQEEQVGLGIEAGAIVIELESLAVDMAGEPTHVALYRFPANRIELIIEP